MLPSPPPDMIHTGGNTFDRDEENVYFIASSVSRMNQGYPYHDHLLIAANDLEGERDLRSLEAWLDAGKKVFLDSGVFNLAMTHARRHKVPHDQALNLAPDDVDGFAALFDRYVYLVRTYGDRLWGYVEIDQGGRENKLRTRARLEALGLRPIPVYHPFGDGWDYFDYLAERYDRICHGNLVTAPSYTRKRLLATAWERHRRYPHLWIHLLGYTPNQWLNALPINSGDSSSWLNPVRWPTYTVKVNGQSFGFLPPDYRSVIGVNTNDPTHGSGKVAGLCAYQQYLDMRVWRHYLAQWTDLGCAFYPPPTTELHRADIPNPNPND